MKRCEICRFRDKYELEKPCVVIRDDCPLYEPMDNWVTAYIKVDVPEYQIGQEVRCYFKDSMYIKGVCTGSGWNNHQVACLLADIFGDTCACNYNGIDEWLPELCDFKDTCCPHPAGVACWEQFLKHSKARYPIGEDVGGDKDADSD